MNTTQKIRVGTLAAALVVAAFVFSPRSKQPVTNNSPVVSLPYIFESINNTTTGTIILTEPFVGASTVKRAFASASTPIGCPSYRAGIVNHHALAADLLAQSARTLKACRPDIETLVIIAPDHFYRGAQALSTAAPRYRTDTALVETDQILQSDFLATVPNVGWQEDVFAKEHGIAALVPFYAHEFPDMAIVPITVKGRVNESEAQALTEWLQKTLKRPKTFVLVSADMSHYLSKEEALANDEITLRALADGDAEFFASASDDFIDSGVQVSIMLKALEKTRWQLLGQKISTDYTKDRDNTTTYIVGFWE